MIAAYQDNWNNGTQGFFQAEFVELLLEVPYEPASPCLSVNPQQYQLSDPSLTRQLTLS